LYYVSCKLRAGWC